MRTNKLFTLVFTLILVIILASCKDDEKIGNDDLKVTIENVLISDGDIVTLEGSFNQPDIEITNMGFEYAFNRDFTEGKVIVIIEDDFQTNFKYDIVSGLKRDSIYYYRAFIELDEKVYSVVKNFVFNGYTPKLFSISPDLGFDGYEIVMSGLHFDPVLERARVLIQGKEATLTSYSDSQIKFIIPKMDYYGLATIELEIDSRITKADFTFDLKGPIIESFVSDGYSGDIITIEGQYFTQNGENTEVFFGDYQASILDLNSESVSIYIPIAENHLLSDFRTSITVVNGSKKVISSEKIRINKSWVQQNATPFKWPWRYTAFTYKESGYILETNYQTLYKYNPFLGYWESGTSFPGERNEMSLFIVVDDKLLKFGGGDSTDPVYSFWEYSFITELWNQKKDMPFSFYNATHFEIDGQIYIVTSSGEVWAYNVEEDTFIRKNNFPTTFIDFGYAFNNGQVVYLIVYGENWVYDLTNDEWSLNSVNTIESAYYTEDALGFLANNSAYVLEQGKNLYKFNELDNSWILVSKYPGCGGGESSKTVFVAGGQIFCAAIYSSNGACGQLMYEYLGK